MTQPDAQPALIGLGVSGGIGAYKSVEVARLLQKRGYAIQVIMTRNARRFIGALTFEAITQRPVITTQWAAGMNADIEHIALATDMKALVVAPATANVIGKFANGLADDFLSALYLATRAPLVLHSMHQSMDSAAFSAAVLTRSLAMVFIGSPFNAACATTF